MTTCIGDDKFLVERNVRPGLWIDSPASARPVYSANLWGGV